MTVVALTGGIAAGKTTVTEVLVGRGIAVVDADTLAREAVAPGSAALAAIVERFGPDILSETGELDRAALGAVVFSDEAARADVNAIVHPEVTRLSQRAFAAHQASQPNIPLVYAVPLLAEGPRTSEFDLVVVVHAPRQMRIQRLVDHRGLSESEASARVDAQASDEERIALADVVVDSSGTEELTRVAAEELATSLLQNWPDRLDRVPRHLPSSSS